jgi:acyl-CoA thioesterase FadM
VEVQLLVAEKKSKALKYVFRLRKLNAPTPYEVARGAITVVCVKLVNGRMRATSIPEAIAAKIQVAPARLLK